MTVLITPTLHCKINVLLWSLLKLFSLSPCYHYAGWMNVIGCLIHKAVIKGLSIFITELTELREAAESLQDKRDSINSLLISFLLTSSFLKFYSIFFFSFSLRQGSDSLPLRLCVCVAISSLSVLTHSLRAGYPAQLCGNASEKLVG